MLVPFEQAAPWFDAFFSSSQDGVLLVDATLTIRQANQASCSLLGCQPGQLVGCQFDVVFGGAFNDTFEERILRFLSSDDRSPIFFTVERQDQLFSVEARTVDRVSERAVLLTVKKKSVLKSVSSVAKADLPLAPPQVIRESNGESLFDWRDNSLDVFDVDVLTGLLRANGTQRLERASQPDGDLSSLVRSYGKGRDHWVSLVVPSDRIRIQEATQKLVSGESNSFAEFYRVQASDSNETWHLLETLIRQADSSDGSPQFLAVVVNLTEAVQLRENFALYRDYAERIVNVLPYTVFLFDFEELCVPFVSSRIQELLGVSAAEVCAGGQNFVLNHMHPDDIADLPQHQQRYAELSPDEVILSEWRMKDRQGQWHCLAGRTTTLQKRPDGTAKLVFGTAEDVTTQKEAAQVQNYFNAIIESSGDSVSSCTLDGTILSWNPASESIFGYSASEVIGKNTSMLVPESERSRVLEYRDILERGEVVKGVETVRLRKDGTLVDVSLTLSPIHNEANEVQRISAICRDISDRKKTERQLHSTSRRLRAVLDGFPDRCFLVTGQGDAIELTRRENRSKTEVFSSETEPMSELFPDESAPELLNVFAASLADSQPHRLEYMTRTIEQEHYFEARFVSIQPDQLLLVIRDITELKRAELRAESNERTIRRLFDLQERERKLLSYEIHDGFVQFVVGAAMTLDAVEHELASDDDANIAGSRETALQLMNEAREMLRNALAEGRAMVSQLRPMIIDERGILEAVDYLIREEEQRNKCEFVFHHHVQFERLPSLIESNLFRIVRESVTNSLRHGKPRRIEISITQNGQQLYLTIADDGLGFDVTLVPDDRFGLEGIRERARLFGGNAHIVSEPGKGTTVSVTLPITTQ